MLRVLWTDCFRLATYSVFWFEYEDIFVLITKALFLVIPEITLLFNGCVRATMPYHYLKIRRYYFMRILSPNVFDIDTRLYSSYRRS